jgi:hypothetical protein
VLACTSPKAQRRVGLNQQKPLDTDRKKCILIKDIVVDNQREGVMNAGIGGIPASGTIVNEMAEDMAIFQEILHWSKSSLLPWQQDALRRIWIQRELEEADVSELLTMAKSHRGASYTGPKPPEPMPLDDNHIAANVVCESAPSLKSMHSLRNVNAISSEQRLEFGVRGLTAIYGENAAGKSSYCRVLKKACRARSKGKTILPNVFAPQSDLLPPQAIFELVDQAGVSKTVTWTDGNPAPPAMSAFALFDADCVRLYVNDAGEVLYIFRSVGSCAPLFTNDSAIPVT